MGSTISVGKRSEYIVIAELMRRGFDVYQTLVDDRGIDCIIRLEKRSPKYLDIQIKARSTQAQLKDQGLFSNLTISPKPNYFFIFYSQGAGAFWVIPSTKLTMLASKSTKGKSKGKYSIYLATEKGGRCIPRLQVDKYRDDEGFSLLK